MNINCKRTFKNKSKPCQKVATVKEMLQKKDTVSNNTLNISETQNESFEVFKTSGANATKKVDFSQDSYDLKQPTNNLLDETIDELYAGLKSKRENNSCDGSSTKSDNDAEELFADSKITNKRSPTDDSQIDESNNYNIDFADILRENLSHCCPVCFKKNNFEDTDLYITHLKSCAYKNKISTEQLKKALELQLKQTTERVALGLPAAPKEKPQKKSYPRNATMDSNLELAIALSTSLQESEIMNKIQEKETLIEAGIEPETLTQYKNLEDYGFASNKPVEATNSRVNRRTKENRNTALFTRTQEERERIITEKVAILLIDDNDQNSPPKVEDIPESSTFKSRYLNKHIDENATLWKKSYQEEDMSEEYYVKSLSNFISPCKVPVGAKLRHLSQIPCRSPSPSKPSTSESFHPVSSPPPLSEKPSVALNLGKKFPKKPRPSTNIDSKFRQDWKYMLNKDIFSDLTIYAKNEVPIFAHKLVFYARCRSILTETIEETENGKSKQMLMWMEYSYEAVMVLLEYIYTGTIPPLNSLADADKKDLRVLSDRYGYREVVDAVDNSEEARLFIPDDERSPNGDTVSECQSLFLALKSDPQSCEADMNVQFDVSENRLHNAQTQMTEGEKNLQILLENMPTQNPRSPEIFSEDDFEHNVCEKNNVSNDSIFEKSTIIEDVLSKLCSPVSSPAKPEEEIEDEDIPLPLTQLPQPVQECSITKNVEKRKSLSPLEKSTRKKSRIFDNDNSFDRNLMPSKRSHVPITDVYEVSDSDESTSKENNEKNTSFASTIDPLPSTSKYKEESPCINDDWEAFEDFNNMYDIGYSPISRPVPIGSPIVETTSKRPSLRKSVTNKATGDSLFDSFSIDEDILNKIETEAKTAATQKPLYSTPESVRKFQRRSKSETSITPINKRVQNIVTPIADYSNMKSEDLKKELEKYGLKPGLSRNKAKLMLRYIYDQLHPFEDEVQTSIQNKTIIKPINSIDDNKKSNRSADSNDSSNSDTSGVDLLEETYAEEDEIYSQDNAGSKNKVSLDTAFRNLLRENESLHQQILLYEPIWVESLKTRLKEYGAKCSMSELMNYLDEKCVTFRSQNQGKHGKRNKKPSQHKRATKQRIQNSESSN